MITRSVDSNYFKPSLPISSFEFSNLGMIDMFMTAWGHLSVSARMFDFLAIFIVLLDFRGVYARRTEFPKSSILAIFTKT